MSAVFVLLALLPPIGVPGPMSGSPQPLAAAAAISQRQDQPTRQPAGVAFSAATLRAQDAWTDCLVEEVMALYQQPEPAQIVADAALVNCRRHETAFERSIAQDTGLSAYDTARFFDSIRSDKRGALIAGIMNLRRGR